MAYVKALHVERCCLCRKVATMQVHNQWNAPLGGLAYCQRHAGAAQRKAEELSDNERAAPYERRLGSAR